MADAFVTFVNLETPDGVSKNTPVKSNQFSVEFKVRVVHAGCYATSVKLWRYSRLPGANRVVASDESSRLQCYCFKGQQERTFFVSADGTSQNPLSPTDPNVTKLSPLTGTWPPYDLPTDTMELFVEVRVYLCKDGACTATSCETLRSRDLRDMDDTGKAKTERHDCDIKNGEAQAQIVEGAAKVAGSAPLPK
jgi:hypothetical protein